nr:hypothetical protein [Advenella mimigardefordensis]
MASSVVSTVARKSGDMALLPSTFISRTASDELIRLSGAVEKAIT